MLGDTNYLYEIANPEKIFSKQIDNAKTWYLDQSLSPCYKIVSYDIQDLNIKYDDGFNQYTFREIDENITLNKLKTTDPFLGTECEILYNNQRRIDSNFDSLQNYFKQSYSIQIEYKTKDLPEDLRVLLNQNVQIKIRLSVNVHAVFEKENNENIILPQENYKTSLLDSKHTYSPLNIKIYSGGEWIEPDKSLYEKMMPFFPVASTHKKEFFINENSFKIAELQFGQENPNVATNAYFLSFRKNNRISDCNKTGNKIFVYPNPSFGNFYIQMKDIPNGNYTFNLYNIIGKKLHTIPFTNQNGEKILIKLEGLSKGTYIYSVDSPEGKKIQTKRLMIMSI